ncbi:MAG: hypothetical protein K5930_04560 [Treponemataceae bacterium]|nr:hypothetical protein [Treponemataceae bacterium]
MRVRKTGVIFFLFILDFFCVLSLSSQTKIISPVEGNWLNPQPLILEKDPDTEVFYSLTGSDPLKSGFAYDGPVALSGYGDLTLTIATVMPNDTYSMQKVSWTVSGRGKPNYIPISDDEAYVNFTETTEINIPDTVYWATGAYPDTILKDDDMQKGGVITMEGGCSIERFLPLILKTSTGYFRYILKINSNADYLLAKPVAEKEGIEFASWNYIRFLNGRNVIYSLDEGPWIQTKEPVFIDRTVAHTVAWKHLTPVYPYETESTIPTEPDIFYIPAKPSFTGIPEGGLTKDFVVAFPDNPDYILEYTLQDGRSVYLRSFYADTVSGDLVSFSPEFTVYYRGIKQGKLSFSVSIDKRPPAMPEIVADETSGFSRSHVALNFRGSAKTFYAVSEPILSDNGFDISDVQNGLFKNLMPEEFSMLESNEEIVMLPALEDSAALYTVYAYSQDEAGNNSDIEEFSTIIDSVNYYVVSDAVRKKVPDRYDESYPLGTKNNPLSSVQEAVQIGQQYGKPNLFIEGVFTDIPELLFYKDCSISGTGETRLAFESDSDIVVRDSSLYLNGCSLEKTVPYTGSVFQKNLVRISGGSFFAENCELFCSFDGSGTGITIDNGSLSLVSCGLTMKATSYTALLSSAVSDITLKNVRGVSSAKTAVGISASGGEINMDNVQLTVNGAFGRGAEFTALKWSMTNSSFTSRNAISATTAVWTDSKSVEMLENNNNYNGFSSLMMRALR